MDNDHYSNKGRRSAGSPYFYVRNDPVNLVDPDGRYAKGIIDPSPLPLPPMTLNSSDFISLGAWSSNACALFIAFMGISISAAHGQVVEERNGNIYFRDKASTVHQVTDSGKDHSPAISPNGTRIVFVRKTGVPVKSEWGGTGTGMAYPRQLWTYGIADGQALILLDSPIEVKGHKFYEFYNPQFSTTGEFVYFLVEYAATSSAIMRIALANKEVKFVADALSYSVITGGEYKDYLIARQRKPKVALGYYYWFYLLSPTGQEVGMIGEDENDVNLFLEMKGGR